MRRRLLKKLGSSFDWSPRLPKTSFLLALPLLCLTNFAQAQFEVLFNVTEPVCYGQPNGSITAITVGGVAPFTYLWSTGAMGPTITGISAGTYTVTVTDNTGFTVIKNVAVTQPTLVTVDLMANVCQIPIIITATGNGGVPPYSYLWSNGATTAVISVNTPGTYCVTMTDQTLCGAVGCITVQLNPLNVSVITNDLDCANINTGQVQAVTTGGTPPFTYQWSNGATTASQANLPPGTYTVTVTDASGCFDTATGVVQSPPPLNVNAVGTNPACNGDNNGNVSATAAGGTPPYTYIWSNGAVGPFVPGLGQGLYTVTVTDANGCNATDFVQLTPLSMLMASATATAESCPDEDDGSATVVATNGVPPYIYLWSNGGNTATINNLSPGFYSVTVIDNVGCFAFANVVVSAAPAFNISVSSTNVTTCDAANGTATVNILQGTGPFIYLWSNGATTQTISGLTAGTYSVTVFDGNGCVDSGATVVTEPPAVFVSIIPSVPVCPGEATGTLTAVVTGGTAPFTFLWSNGATTQSIQNLPSGAYSVTVTDAFGCQDTETAIVPQAPGVSVTINGTETVCGAENDGSATAVVSGGIPPFVYQWSNGSNSQSINDLPEGSYSVTVTDANGCSDVDEIFIDIIDDFLLDISIQNILCFGENTGSITAEGWGGTPPYMYNWSNGVTGTPTISNLTAGFYAVTVTDQNGCQLIESFILTQPPLLTASATATNLVCPGETTGTATAMGSAGTPPYTYLWNTGATTSIITGLGAGTYTVTVTDANNCEATAQVTINQAPGVTVVITGTDIVCGAGNTGSATANVSGGTAPFSYLWSNGSQASSVSGLGEGTVSVTVTDANGCTATDDFVIEIIDDLSVSGIVKNILCNGDNNGEITLIVTGGDMPYTYNWNLGQPPVPNLTGLAPGVYNVTVTDANGCTATNSFTVTQPAPLNATAGNTGTICPGASNGVANVIATGGTMPYTYLWNNGATTQTIFGLSAGTYTVTVTDANNCTATSSTTIQESPDVNVTVTGTNTVCGMGNTGSASANASGGVPPYTYTWSNGATTSSISGLVEGIYTVTVTDANGCTATGSIAIDVIDDLSVTLIPRDVLCFGDNTGSILAIPSGGTAPYSYLWSNGATGNEILDLTVGTYSVTVTDQNGCTAIQSVTINQPSLLTAAASGTNITCAGFANGTASVVANGGTPPYSYLWSNGATTTAISNLGPGTYTVTVTDENLCTATASVTITQPQNLMGSVMTNDPLCFGDTDGTASASVSGGTPPYSYSWSNGQTGANASNLGAGSYNLTVTDANGCMIMLPFTINQPTALNVTLDITDIFCEDANTGAITANATGGTPPYSYEWSNGGSGMTIINLAAGTYTVTVTDANECEAIISGTVQQFPGLMLTPVASAPNCFGENSGAAAVVVAGGTPPLSYLWSNGATTPEILNVPAGAYSVTVTDAIGCTGTETVVIVQPNELIATISSVNVIDASCNGFADGSATVSVSGGTPPYSYNWSNGQTGATANNLSAGTYTVVVADANGCTEMLSVQIEEPPLLVVNVMTSVSGTCQGETDGAASAAASGGTPPYTYAWSNGATTSSISNLAAGTYFVTVTDASGCVATSSVSITAFPNPSCSITVTQEISIANNDGAVAVSGFGGTAPYSFNWSNGQTGSAISGLTPGTYTATVTDANGCTSTCSVTLFPLAQLGDYVWLDEDRDGIQDANEDGVEGVMVILQIPGEADPINIDTTFTDANGYYIFNVPPGEYKVTFVLPDGLLFTDPDEGANDGVDSDANPDMGGMSHIVVLGPGESDLTIDAGLVDKCHNVTNPGQIGPNQFLCGPGNDPAPIVNIVSPSGGSGALEYLWMMSTIPGPFNDQYWIPIPDSNSPNYDPGVLYETTYFARCVRRECCTVYLESNIVTIEVGTVAVADINSPDFLCIGETTTLYAGPTGAGAVINWQLSGPVTPTSGTGPQIQVQATNFGIVHITLTVTENGCTSTDLENVYASNSPINCGNLMPIIVNVVDEEAGEIAVSWAMDETEGELQYTLERSADGVQFKYVADVNQPSAHLNSTNVYEHLDGQAKRGHNYYRVRLTNAEGEYTYSEIGHAILQGNSEIAMIYPNPIDNQLVLELFETFGQEVEVEILSIDGHRLHREVLDAETTRREMDFSNFPSGAYLLKIRYSESGVKVLKVLKR
ncbi:MAG TPA: SdrD B-like domain-containing protein [Saprospiraceae bacterium]|nr:SdrD B-like domain-containing protein [Saprospiraceae bacterium]HMQ83848.1 SdrD B-like domain-containing protein [Saprospiraceae bacterium]